MARCLAGVALLAALRPGMCIRNAADELRTDSWNKACYCAEVTDESECPLSDQAEPALPDGPQFFHAAAEGAPARCCRYLVQGPIRSLTGWLAGQSTNVPIVDKAVSTVNKVFHEDEALVKQDEDFLCRSEVRVVPSTSCCHVQVRPSEGEPYVKMGLRLSKVTMLQNTFSPVGQQERPVKDHPHITVADITGSTDFDGSDVSAEAAQAYIQNLAINGGHFMGSISLIWCQETLSELLAGPATECKLRPTHSQECCCPSSTLGKREDPTALCVKTGLTCPSDEEHVSGTKGSATHFAERCATSCKNAFGRSCNHIIR